MADCINQLLPAAIGAPQIAHKCASRSFGRPTHLPTSGDEQMLLTFTFTRTSPGCAVSLHETNALNVVTQSIAASMYMSTALTPGGRVSVMASLRAGAVGWL